mgnify:CR=1 FL=1
MPVVISLLNSFTGVAAALGGFLYDNAVMLTGGILVGSAGTILTILMCQAMNRPLWNVIFGSFGGGGAGAGSDSGEQIVKTISVTDAAILCAYAKRVAIVPGYGLAVAQAQHALREMVDTLKKNDIKVSYAIHPVAGRMPGHMNVLLAEANVPYDIVFEMDEINDDLPEVDVLLVVGANDIVNPSALEDSSSPIAGMPVIEAWNAKSVVALKRSMAAGYSGVENPLYFKDNTNMLFGDAKDTLSAVFSKLG